MIRTMSDRQSESSRLAQKVFEAWDVWMIDHRRTMREGAEAARSLRKSRPDLIRVQPLVRPQRRSEAMQRAVQDYLCGEHSSITDCAKAHGVNYHSLRENILRDTAKK